jgi:hypothetical protein
LQGLSRAEAAERMGIGEARMRKLMEGAGPGRPGVAGKVGALLETIEAGDWCEQQSSLMRAYAFGVLAPDGERHTLAAAHCRECPACRAHVASLRGLASVLPLPLLPTLAGAGGASRTGRAVARGRGVAGTRAAGTGGRTTAATGTSSAPGGGWAAVPGSLTAKLAATAVVLVAGGYAAFGGHAHASPAARRAHGAPSALAPAPLVSALANAPFAGTPRARAGHAVRKPTSRATGRHHALAGGGAPASVEAAAREFGPERAGAAPAQTTTPPASAPAGEFGIE